LTGHIIYDEYGLREYGAEFSKWFWSNTDRSDRCWTWLGSRRQDGYGIVRVDGANTGAHRVAWELHHHRRLTAPMALHSCDNPPCVRPDHLRQGSAMQNVWDAIERRRHCYGGARADARLTNEQAVEAYLKFWKGRQYIKQIAEEYGVNPGVISGIVWRQSYRAVIEDAGLVKRMERF
jgi:hypothetical protein